MLIALRLTYACLLLYCLTFFAYWTLMLLRRRNPDYSIRRRTGFLGVLSVFTRGMFPWRKESARNYPLSYIAGILYHISTFTCLLILGFPGLLEIGENFIPILLLGVASGLYLLLKRGLDRRYRELSEFDDYFSNLLVDAMQLSVLLAVLGVVRPFVPYAGAYLVLLYLPFGKLKHCYFFFASRLLLGASFGRRGVII
jgi:hypothetical protein